MPCAPFRAFAVQCTVLDNTLLVWCGAAPSSLADAEEDDEEIVQAMRDAGRALPRAAALNGRLTADWAVAMNRVCGKNIADVTGTQLYEHQSAMAIAMAQRLATKLEIAQVLLSLDLPEQLCTAGIVPLAPEHARALQCLELGIRRACSMALGSST
ncbi:hypothetical protein MVES1_001399 [Malassezia vespertilionis]|uniref:uncharacterized protein n=1 Tax=Malassezia vespertilionis TaxID=2020962 RepID=UPI0024B09AFE|nr:uncharacterized protein MVES1_001399 [Malassezia vespertilionis]WFD06060.1 hypothetical protein MVES1_001399 [Malassezia vespertilionis]